MPKKDWKAELKKLTYSKGSDPLKMDITPYRDWRILVIASFLGLVGALGYNIYITIQINSDVFSVVTQKSSGVAKFNEEGLTKLVLSIDQKAAIFEKIRNEGMAVVDPSI